jgi:dTDP-4-amino-4,6-dideoxygalactose transaminase
MEKIFYGKQSIIKSDISAAVKCLKSNFLTGGPNVGNFEKEISKITGCKYSLSCNSGTSAIFLTALTLDLKKGENIIVPNISFVASFNIFSFLDCNVYLADVDSCTGQITPESIIQCIKKEKINKLKCFVTMPLGGSIINAEGFYDIKKKYKCFWMEDNCHALGSSYSFKNKIEKGGSCRHSDFSIFSFHPIKAITTFEGGCINFKSKKLFNKAKLLRSHGITKKKNYWEYDVILNGFNFRLSDVSAAVGISQLKRLKQFIAKRRSIAKLYFKLLKNNKNIKFNFHKFPIHNSWHLFIILIDFKYLKFSKKYFIKKLNSKGIFPQVNYIPTSKFSVYKGKKNFKLSENFFNKEISLPIFFDLKNKQIIKICDHINNVILGI